MKKVFLVCVMCLATLTMYAQRCAVLEFSAGVGVSRSDVEGISAIFNTYFRPAGYTMVDRTEIDRVIDEQRFQRSSMTESQKVRVGKILNVSKVVVGIVNVVMGTYNVDVKVVNVETGTEVAKDGATFSGGDAFRSTMQSMAQRLASKVAIRSGGTVSGGAVSGGSSSTSPSPSSPRKRSSVETLYGYLRIFPNELGEFQSEPTTVIAQINAQEQYGYNTWRLPTNEELSLMRANNYLSKAQYMSKENKQGIVLLVTDGTSQEEQQKTIGGIEMIAGIELVKVEGGTFIMGCTSEQGGGCDSDESPSHNVTISPFYIGKYEVTQKQWREITGSNPSKFTGDNNPVENVSWNEIQLFIQELNAKTGKNFRLPTEAEWEYAARGGNKSKGYKYSGSNFLTNVAWYSGNANSTTHPVGQKQPNELGIYDMSGNVWEWCYDWYSSSYSSSAQTDPYGPSSGSDRVLRGGSWDSSAGCRVANRTDDAPSTRDSYSGFRLALSLKTKEEEQKIIEEQKNREEYQKRLEREEYQKRLEEKRRRLIPMGYVELGLPSGTFWKNQNESGGLYTYEQAVSKFGNNLPTKEQFEELKSSCRWQWTGSGYKVTGPNGNFINLPAAGYRGCSGGTYYVGSRGYYWSSTPNGSDKAWGLDFNSSSVNVDSYGRCSGQSVRLVQD